MEQKLIEILGNNAFNNDMRVDNDVAKLVKTVKYLTTQINIVRRYCAVDGVEYINTVLETAESILNDE